MQTDFEDFISKDHFRQLIELSPNPVLVADKSGIYKFVNKAACNFLGYERRELVGKSILDIIHPKDSRRLSQVKQELLNGVEENGDWEFLRKDGTFVWGEVHTRMLTDNICVAFVSDITNFKQAEERTSQAENRYRTFIEQTNEGIWRIEFEPPVPIDLPAEEIIGKIYKKGRIAECNEAMAHQNGFSGAGELIGKNIEKIIDRSMPVNLNYLFSFIRRNYQLKDFESHGIDRQKREKYYLNNLLGTFDNGKLVGIWGTQRDITATKRAVQAVFETEEKQRQSGKVEAIGRLAGGIAHDFNNILAVIMLHIDMLNLQLPAESPLRFRIDEIRTVTQNAAGMVRQLLAFGRKQTLQPNPVVLNKVVKEFTKSLGSLIGEDIEIKLELDPDLGVCFVDQNQITQVLMNLAVNSRDAMPDGGKLFISTSNVKIEPGAKKHKAQPKGAYIQLSVRDNGVGMDKKIRDRIFEPFFTTKEATQGTGLGLATVYGIVKQSDGFIWVKSELGEGAEFMIQFPRIDKPAEVSKPEKNVVIPSGNETILLVEDEEQIRRAAVEVLNVLGYQVFEAGSGTQAIQLAELYKAPIHLLLTDVIMPRMNGREVAEKVKALHPETTVLFMSGYTDDIISKHGVLEEDVHFINKPFTPSILATKIREILES